MLVQQACDVFLADRKINGYTAKTLDFYECSVGGLITFFHDQVGEIEVGEIAPHVSSKRTRLLPARFSLKQKLFRE